MSQGASIVMRFSGRRRAPPENDVPARFITP